MNKALKHMLPSTPLVCNLTNKEYERIILNGCSNLEERFAQIDSHIISDQIKQSRENSDILSPPIKKVMRQPNFPQLLSTFYASVVG